VVTRESAQVEERRCPEQDGATRGPSVAGFLINVSAFGRARRYDRWAPEPGDRTEWDAPPGRV